MTKPDASRKRVFVYGSLMTGLHNHHYLAEARRSGEATIAAGKFAMISLGAFPGLILDPQGATVPGELYDVDGDTLAELDRLEGHPRCYRRRLVYVTCEGNPVTALVYVLNSPRFQETLVPDNDWRAFQAARQATYGQA